MTIEEFFKDVKEKVKEGLLVFHKPKNIDEMVLSSDGACILCARVRLDHHDFRWTMSGDKAAKLLGISEEDASWIMDANDDPDHEGRQQLLEACGLA